MPNRKDSNRSRLARDLAKATGIHLTTARDLVVAFATAGHLPPRLDSAGMAAALRDLVAEVTGARLASDFGLRPETARAIACAQPLEDGTRASGIDADADADVLAAHLAAYHSLERDAAYAIARSRRELIQMEEKWGGRWANHIDEPSLSELLSAATTVPARPGPASVVVDFTPGAACNGHLAEAVATLPARLASAVAGLELAAASEFASQHSGESPLGVKWGDDDAPGPSAAVRTSGQRPEPPRRTADEQAYLAFAERLAGCLAGTCDEERWDDTFGRFRDALATVRGPWLFRPRHHLHENPLQDWFDYLDEPPFVESAPDHLHVGIDLTPAKVFLFSWSAEDGPDDKSFPPTRLAWDGATAHMAVGGRSLTATPLRPAQARAVLAYTGDQGLGVLGPYDLRFSEPGGRHVEVSFPLSIGDAPDDVLDAVVALGAGTDDWTWQGLATTPVVMLLNALSGRLRGATVAEVTRFFDIASGLADEWDGTLTGLVDAAAALAVG